jgi:nucleoside-diphosphate-sugar epimerase
MKVLVVGASGFVGRALCDRLLAEGHHVDAWDRRGGASATGMQRLAVDLLGATALPRPKQSTWDVAFHLAAHAVPGLSWTRSLVLENLAMTARLMDHLAEHAPGCLTILASSGQVYAPSAERLVEDAPIGPRQPYGLSKQLCETWALSKRDQLRIQVVRAFNQIGPGMAKGLLIPDLLEMAMTNETPLTMKGRNDWKDFLDCRDAIDAYMLLMQTRAPSGSVWNLCSGQRTQVSVLVHAILSELGADREVRFASPLVETLVGDPSKLMGETGWTPRRTMHETVRNICSPIV